MEKEKKKKEKKKGGALVCCLNRGVASVKLEEKRKGEGGR